MLLIKVAQRIVFIDFQTVNIGPAWGEEQTCILLVKFFSIFGLTISSLAPSIFDAISNLQ